MPVGEFGSVVCRRLLAWCQLATLRLIADMNLNKVADPFHYSEFSSRIDSTLLFRSLNGEMIPNFCRGLECKIECLRELGSVHKG